MLLSIGLENRCIKRRVTILSNEGTRQMIRTMLKKFGEMTTVELVERVKLFNTDCADRVPMELACMKSDGEIIYSLDKKNRVFRWSLVKQEKSEENNN